MRLTIAAGAVLIAAFAAYFFFSPRGDGVAHNLTGAAHAQNSGAIDVSAIAEMRLGNADAPVTVIEYASFTCVHCATFHRGPYRQLKAAYIDTGKINFIYREVYFDRFGLWASAIARCAGPQKFFGIADLIYKGQQDWIRAGGGDPAAIVGELRKIGRLSGMDDTMIDACLGDQDKLRTLVAWYQENAETHGIRSTPSFVINGTSYQNMSYDEMKDIIDVVAQG